MQEKIKVVFMGTPNFAVPALKTLIDDENFDVLALLCQPDKPRGRSKELIAPPTKARLKEWALTHNIEVLQPKTLRSNEDIVETLKSFNADFFVVVAYGKILPKEVLDIPAKGCINLHASLLPKYRGAAPVNWAIINGDKVTGNTTMYMDVGMDTGDMLLKDEVTIENSDRADSVLEKLSSRGGSLLIKTLNAIIKGEVKREKQNNEQATMAPLMKKEDGRVRWDDKAQEIENRFRGFYPWPGTFTTFRDKTVKIHDLKVLTEEEITLRNIDLNEFNAGEICHIDKDEIIVKCKDLVLSLKELQMEGKKRVKADAFQQGYRSEKKEAFR